MTYVVNGTIENEVMVNGTIVQENVTDGAFVLLIPGDSEDELRAVLSSLTLKAPQHSDVDFDLVVTVEVDKDIQNNAASHTFSLCVKAVADPPSVEAENLLLVEDSSAPLNTTVSKSPDTDGSEILSMVFTVRPDPDDQDNDQPIGVLTATNLPTGVVFNDLGNGVYNLTVEGDLNSTHGETILNNLFLGGGVVFTPRPDWSGFVENGIEVVAVSTENANGYGDGLALNNDTFDETIGDFNTKEEVAVAYIDVNVTPVPEYINTDIICLQEHEAQGSRNNSKTTQVNFGAALNNRIKVLTDNDGSERLQISISGFPSSEVTLNTPSLAGSTSRTIDGNSTYPESLTLEGLLSNVSDTLESYQLFVTDRDADPKFNLTVTMVLTDTNGETGNRAIVVNQTYTLVHHIIVTAFADDPFVNVPSLTDDDFVVENSGIAPYGVNISLRDVDGSETYDEVEVTVSTAGGNDGSDPIVKFDNNTYSNVSIVTSSSGRTFTLKGPVADLEAILKTMEIAPGADNGEDISVKVTARTVESNPTITDHPCTADWNSDGGKGSFTSDFNIEVKPLLGFAPPTLNVDNNTKQGIEDTLVDIGTIEIVIPVDLDGSESYFIDVRKDSVPNGTIFFLDGIPANAFEVEENGDTWLRLASGSTLSATQRNLQILVVESPDGEDSHFSGSFNMIVRGTVRDSTEDDEVFSSSLPDTIPVEVLPVADCVEFDISETLVDEDLGPANVGPNIAAGLHVIDNGTDEQNNNNQPETIASIALSAPEGQTLTGQYVPNGVSGTIVPGIGSSSVTYTLEGGVALYTISSSIIDAATGDTSAQEMATAMEDILRTLETFQYPLIEDSDENQALNVAVTTIDINLGTVSISESCSSIAEIVVRAIADVSFIQSCHFYPTFEHPVLSHL